MKKVDVTGKRFGRLLVLKKFDVKNGGSRWECLCDCGKKHIVSLGNLGRTTKSCGCLGKESLLKISKDGHSKIHGMTRSTTYRSWESMKTRIGNKNHEAFEHYSKKKITICERWINSFENFLEDMGKRPNGKTLDRIDNSRGYSKENCRWATPLEQRLNADNIHYMELNGKKQIMKEWAEELGMNYSTLQMRVNKFKWSDYRALTTPVRNIFGK